MILTHWWDTKIYTQAHIGEWLFQRMFPIDSNQFKRNAIPTGHKLRMIKEDQMQLQWMHITTSIHSGRR